MTTFARIEMYVCAYCEALLRTGVCVTCNDYKGAIEWDTYYEELDTHFATASTEYLRVAFERNWRRGLEQLMCHRSTGAYDVDACDLAVDTVSVIGKELARRGLPSCSECGTVGLHSWPCGDA